MRSVKKVLLPLLVAGTLAGCAQGNGGVEGLFGPRASRTDLAYAALAQGDFAQALRQAGAALEDDPTDPHALFARAVALRNVGRGAEAAPIFARLAESERAQGATVSGGAWTGMAPTTVTALAAANLEGPGKPAAAPTVLMPAALVPPPASAMPASVVTVPSSPAAEVDAGAKAPAPAAHSPMDVQRQPPLSGIELLNAAQRFLVLRRLRDEGMVTDAEYAARRTANIGALLPYSAARPPAEGLGRPVPTAEQVMARLEALRQSLAGGSLRPEEHAAEREAIIDAILPADPRARMAPPSPPMSLGDAAERANALQRLRDMGVISGDDYGRERAALEKAAGRLMSRGDGAAGTVLVPKAPSKPASSSSAKKPAPAKPAPAPLVPKTDADVLKAGARGGDSGRMVGQGPTVVPAPAAQAAPARGASSAVVLHLASYKSKDAAEAGWNDLRTRFRKQLGGLSPQYAELNLGAGGGTYWRLNAGPISDQAAAERLCSQLTAQGQYCRTAFADG